MSRRPPFPSRPVSVAEPPAHGASDAFVHPKRRDDAEERIAFLARAGEVLSASLEWRTVLQRLAELTVPLLETLLDFAADGDVYLAAFPMGPQVQERWALDLVSLLDPHVDGVRPEVTMLD